MQSYIDFFVSYWYIILVLALVIVIALGILLKRGSLESLDLFGIKINFNSEEKILSKFPHLSLKDYAIQFTKTASDNISILGITEDKVLNLVENEFTHHVNYFKWDLQDYPLPVQQNYIVILDKNGKSLTIRAVKSSNLDEAQLISINNLLADYRRLSRYKYRTVLNYVLRPEIIKEIVSSHIGILRLLYKHYSLYKEPNFRSDHFFIDYANYDDLIELVEDAAQIAEILKEKERLPLPSNKVFSHNVVTAFKTLRGIDKLTSDLENGLISSDVADREIVLSLESSLQYIHKTISLLLSN